MGGSTMGAGVGAGSASATGFAWGLATDGADGSGRAFATDSAGDEASRPEAAVAAGAATSKAAAHPRRGKRRGKRRRKYRISPPLSAVRGLRLSSNADYDSADGSYPEVPAMRLALPAALVVAAAAAFVVRVGSEDVIRPTIGGADAARVAELVTAARASERFGFLYPTVAVGWRKPGLAHTIVSRPPGLDLGARAAFAAVAAVSGDDAAARARPAIARAFALGTAAAAVIAFARLAWIGWGPAAAGTGAALLALSPYMGAFATLPHGGMPALAASLMALGSALRFRRTRARSSTAAAVAWLVVAGLFDWSAYLLVVPLGAIAFVGRGLAGRVTRVHPSALGLPR
jgi:hypothetical protein